MHGKGNKKNTALAQNNYGDNFSDEDISLGCLYF